MPPTPFRRRIGRSARRTGRFRAINRANVHGACARVKTYASSNGFAFRDGRSVPVLPIWPVSSSRNRAYERASYVRVRWIQWNSASSRVCVLGARTYVLGRWTIAFRRGSSIRVDFVRHRCFDDAKTVNSKFGIRSLCANRPLQQSIRLFGSFDVSPVSPYMTRPASRLRAYGRVARACVHVHTTGFGVFAVRCLCWRVLMFGLCLPFPDSGVRPYEPNSVLGSVRPTVFGRSGRAREPKRSSARRVPTPGFGSK